MKLIAGSGKVTVQAQDGEMEFGASKDVHIYSLEKIVDEVRDTADSVMESGQSIVDGATQNKITDSVIKGLNVHVEL